MENFGLKGVTFLFILFLFSGCGTFGNQGQIMTVNGLIQSDSAGIFLTHEHLLVDFIGADSINPERWNREEVVQKMLPYLIEAKEIGCQTFVDCTPDYLGRDVHLLQELSKLSGVNILTNTGLYGVVDNKFLPKYAFEETADELAQRWISEWENGIDDTDIKPGFIKIGVNYGSLSEMHRKLISAAAKTHLKTGLVIASHTGQSVPAFEQLDVLKQEGVSPDAFIWVHAQAEKDSQKRIEAASQGAWVSLDGLGENNISDYVRMITELKDANLLPKVLLSHDAGWFDPAQPEGGNIRGFTTLFDKLLPALLNAGFTREDIRQLIEVNSATAYQFKVRKITNN